MHIRVKSSFKFLFTENMIIHNYASDIIFPNGLGKLGHRKRKGDHIGDVGKVRCSLTFPASTQSNKILNTEIAEVFLK